MTRKQGRCLCGNVVFEYTGPETWCYHCHCASCRRATASPFTSYVSVPTEAYKFVGKPPAIYKSSPSVRRFFCPDCGTPVAYETTDFSGIIDFYAATLDDPESVTPEFHVHFAEKLSWLNVNDGLPRHEASAVTKPVDAE